MKCRKFQIDIRMSKKHSWSVGLLILYQWLNGKSINVQNLPSSVYFIKIETNKRCSGEEVCEKMKIVVSGK